MFQIRLTLRLILGFRQTDAGRIMSDVLVPRAKVLDESTGTNFLYEGVASKHTKTRSAVWVSNEDLETQAKKSSLAIGAAGGRPAVLPYYAHAKDTNEAATKLNRTAVTVIMDIRTSRIGILNEPPEPET